MTDSLHPTGNPGPADPPPATREVATFAGGCFWCMVHPFEETPGVVTVVSGFTGGHKENPTYKEVVAGGTGHCEAVQITFDPAVMPYERMLSVYWQQTDPTDPGGQFADRGSSYRTAIFYHSEQQREQATASKQALEDSGRFDKPIATEIVPAGPFYPAEEYHQDYHRKNPAHYRMYRKGSGREAFIASVWSKRPPNNDLRKRLTPLQFKVTQENGTERPFTSEFHKGNRDGIYVDVVSGVPLFSSRDQFDAGCGWPSFSQPLDRAEVAEKVDRSLGMARTEVRSRTADSHLGHVFDDGPGPGGLRYCINGAALRFVPREELEEQGYGKYRELFE